MTQPPRHHENGACSCHPSPVQSVHQTLDEMDFERGIWNPALNGDLEGVKRHILSRGKPNEPDPFGYTALHYASRNGHYDICHFLLAHGASCNVRTHGGATPLHRAAYCGHTAIAKLLLGHGADPAAMDDDGKTSLHKVSEERPEEKVGCFAARTRGTAWEPERWRSGPAAPWWESVEREKQKAEDEKKKKLEALNNARLKIDTLEDLAAIVKHHKQKKKKCKKVVLPKPQEPEIIIESVEPEQFLDAALENRILVIDKYLADGGDPNIHDKFKCTALHRACLRGHKEIVDKLLEAGAKVEPRDMLEATPLFWACRGGHLEILKALISRGAKISTRDKEGDTPIHDAVRLGRFQAVKTLLMYGANLNIQNEEAVTPVDLVKDWQTGIRETLQMCANRQQGLTRSC
ncbi:ankyrin repeat domain-containing protein 23-like isoform X2 [Thamnophis elegans]|uniref:ankyrin repeat domain-containing protein 23-like isoform X2 n=1 Tax=Thamnophis elegans TaxID=35005 RepID=UPI001378ED94|nr:ankyrin repeat domain-containing protein 23-like isoform X2 [Thamnophis elegans]